MTRRERVLRSPEYWFQGAQLDLYREVNSYLKQEDITKTELAEKLNVSKGYISQILNGNFNYTLKKLIDISLAIGIVPQINYKKIEDIIKEDTEGKTEKFSRINIPHNQQNNRFPQFASSFGDGYLPDIPPSSVPPITISPTQPASEVLTGNIAA